VTDHEPDWPIVLRRQPASPGTGHQEDHTGMFEVICGKCGDDPGLDYQEVSSELRQIRGPYPLAAGIASVPEARRVPRQSRGDGLEGLRARARPQARWARGEPLIWSSRAGLRRGS
jgi:hypothetical protein